MYNSLVGAAPGGYGPTHADAMDVQRHDVGGLWDVSVDVFPGPGGNVQLAGLLIGAAVILAAMKWGGFRAMVAVGRQ